MKRKCGRKKKSKRKKRQVLYEKYISNVVENTDSKRKKGNHLTVKHVKRWIFMIVVIILLFYFCGVLVIAIYARIKGVIDTVEFCWHLIFLRSAIKQLLKLLRKVGKSLF